MIWTPKRLIYMNSRNGGNSRGIKVSNHYEYVRGLLGEQITLRCACSRGIDHPRPASVRDLRVEPEEVEVILDGWGVEKPARADTMISEALHADAA